VSTNSAGDSGGRRVDDQLDNMRVLLAGLVQLLLVSMYEAPGRAVVVS
jgi:hypothetical protein